MGMKTHNRGFTIFFAMLVGSLALSIGLAIYDLTLREIDLSSTATQSQYAIYAADSGIECALYWDNKATMLNGSFSAFATSSNPLNAVQPSAGILCNGQDVAANGTPGTTFGAPPGSGTTAWSVWAVTKDVAGATTTFTLSFLQSGQPYCAIVQVAKFGDPPQTTVVSRGYNTCASGGLRLERVLQVGY